MRGNAVDAAVDFRLRLRVIGMSGLWSNDVRHFDSFGGQRVGHQIGGLFLFIDFAAVSDRRAVEEIDRVIGRVVKTPEFLLVPSGPQRFTLKHF